MEDRMDGWMGGRMDGWTDGRDSPAHVLLHNKMPMKLNHLFLSHLFISPTYYPPPPRSVSLTRPPASYCPTVELSFLPDSAP